ncbi:hypothetical protein [Rhodopirellula sallentina]|uniref:Signal peptide protein n=1 Tax=Rhodopirellula sallentina SM41 TaxID=1263870 RepID=M5U9L3_9BACT|nr:hypothetical protein [Rhodopirellula sallentina]EMI57994.1 signal peptide protein [Rhodopirellula sallentina SM41]
MTGVCADPLILTVEVDPVEKCLAASGGKPIFTMLRMLALVAAVCFAGLMDNRSVHAQCFGPYGFQAYGFYQPYGAQYRSRVGTPPYFALNPPVYYGTRHFRPYGISPFAAPPQVSAPAGYHGQAGASGLRARTYEGPVSNPFICRSASFDAPVKKGEVVENNWSEADTLATANTFKPGQIRSNPFVEVETHLVSR